MLYLEIKRTSDKGNGVFATKNFSPGEVIEICPAIPLTAKEVKTIESTSLENWFFEWQEDLDAMLFGYGMIYNHSPKPNATYEYDYPNSQVIFICKKAIKTGQQIFINYNQYGHHKKNYIPMFHPKTGKTFLYKTN